MGPHICFSAFGSGCCPGWMLAPGSGQCVLREYGRRGWHRVGVPAPSRSRAPQRSAPSAAAAASALRPTSARAPTESGASPAQVGPPPPPPRAAGPGARAWVAGCPRCPAEPLSAFQSRWGTAGSTAATSPVTTVGARRWPASVPSASPWWRRTPASAATVSRGERGVAAGGRGGPGVPQPPAPSPLARRHQRVPERRLRGAVRQHRGWLRLRVRPRHAARRQPPQLPGCAGPGLGGGGGGRSAGALSLGLCPADTDECLATPCQHRCKNSVGSYRCSCRPGYHLHGNRHSCVGECRAPSLRPRAIAAAPRAPRRHPSPTCSHRDPSPRGGNPPRPRALPAPRRAAPGLGAAAGDADALRIPQTSTSAGSRASAVRASTRATTHRAASSAPAGPATGSAGTGCPAKVTARSSTRERPPNSPR